MKHNPTLHGRRTADYSPLLVGSKEEQRAISARREMLDFFKAMPEYREVKRKGWLERMTKRAAGFHPGKPR